jgi:hypothetical protein
MPHSDDYLTAERATQRSDTTRPAAHQSARTAGRIASWGLPPTASTTRSSPDRLTLRGSTSTPTRGDRRDPDAEPCNRFEECLRNRVCATALVRTRRLRCAPELACANSDPQPLAGSSSLPPRAKIDSRSTRSTEHPPARPGWTRQVNPDRLAISPSVACDTEAPAPHTVASRCGLRELRRWSVVLVGVVDREARRGAGALLRAAGGAWRR